MQKNKLPLKIDPIRCAQKRLDYSGVYPKVIIKRLAASVVDILCDVVVELSCEFDHQRLIVIKGTANVDVMLLCQRCLNEYPYHIAISYCFTPERVKQVDEMIPEHYEIVSLDEWGEIDLVGIIEDELILALPLIPTHDNLNCQFSVSNKVFGEIPEMSESASPFAMLSKLKK